MTELLKRVRLLARIGYILAAWGLVALIAVQVFHAGHAVLVSPGDWRAHRTLGEMFSIPILPMVVLSVVGWMPIRFTGTSLALFSLYALQFLLVYQPFEGMPWLAALHPVNALALFALAAGAARGAWRLVVAEWDGGAPVRRAILAASVAAVVAASVSAGVQAGNWTWAEAGGAVASLADAGEDDVPERYRTMTSPFPGAIGSGEGVNAGPSDHTESRRHESAVAAGRQLAEQRCAGCHGADFRGRQLGAVRSADLVQSAGARSEQFLMWAISEGSQRGMPAHSHLPEEQRWQLVAFLKSLKP
ncbi:mono/diheme cytochrome c family protein [Symbiobacterium terraclitae]|uniref:Mono/diheme cytochrome c family protein n=1 Tax=Symbiobacterium terraclitae TaxID=557451 RepID=A0ABS4JQD6_9FIRM|nr:DUF6220 domain-containing protein [Symbiobacterium terraclitae]MBP2017737.1 mono/diheme cytochrome c family protein [Symbiobacterium terraclitae]